MGKVTQETIAAKKEYYTNRRRVHISCPSTNRIIMNATDEYVYEALEFPAGRPALMTRLSLFCKALLCLARGHDMRLRTSYLCNGFMIECRKCYRMFGLIIFKQD